MANQNLYQLTLKVDKLNRRLDEVTSDLADLRSDVEQERSFAKSLKLEAVNVEQDVSDTVENQARSASDIARLRSDHESIVSRQDQIRDDLAALHDRQGEAEKALVWLIHEYWARQRNVQIPEQFKQEFPRLFLPEGAS